MKWKHPSVPPPKYVNVISSIEKCMASVFFYAKGIVFIVYYHSDETHHQWRVQNQLAEAVTRDKDKHAGKLTKRSIYLSGQ